MYLLLLLAFVPSSYEKVFVLGTLFSWGGWYPVGKHGGAGAVRVAVDEILTNKENFHYFRESILFKSHTRILNVTEVLAYL